MAQTVAVISGAGRGIGREVAAQLGRQGVTVVVGARDAAAGEAVAAELAEVGIDARALQLDVSDQRSVEAAAARLECDPGRVDVLVNNAGVGGSSDGAGAADLEAVKETLETNLFGAWRLTAALLPLLRAGGHGRVVNISSGMGQLDDMGAGQAAYRVSKTGLNALTRILANEERDAGVLVNSVCPGWVRTDMGGPSARSSVAEGAETPVWLATLPDDGPSGGFFRYREPIPW